MLAETVAANLRKVQERMARAAERAGRDPASVTLVAVTKYAELDWVRALLDLGCRDLGENRPQQLLERAEALGSGIRWHLIGHLQRNKVRKVLPVTELIHSVDSPKLLADIDRIARELSVRPRVLLEVNLVQDPKRHGFLRDELPHLWPLIQSRPADAPARIEGLMTMAEFTEDAERVRGTFADLRRLRDRLSPAGMPQLSMGMTSDFETAIEEGATLVRIGSALWESLGVGAF